jgi:arylsulfatase A-like enzyme
MKVFLRNHTYLINYILLLTLVFFCAEISFFIQSTQIYFSDFKLISHHINVPNAIIPGIVFYIFAQLLLHMGFALLIGWVVLSLTYFFKCSSTRAVKLATTLWLCAIITVFVTNQYFFPNSKFSDLTRVILPDFFLPYLSFALSFFWSVMLLLCAYISFRMLRVFVIPQLDHLFFRRRIPIVIIITLLFTTGYCLYQNYFYVTTDASSEEKPNIIIIGVDSLRPDFLGYFGSNLKTDFYDSFLRQSTVFTHAYTPLARTYPSWMGILSGLYPKQSGVRFNLAGHTESQNESLLSTLLHQQGYRSIFATDESQFSNIDEEYGFDEAITPPIGLNNFLLGTFNDFPLSNIVVNTAFGRWLFPHSYANRPAFVTYNPNSFLSRLKPLLKKSRHQPLFLCVHFCLTHYPYLWAEYSGKADNQASSRYSASIAASDQQVGNFLSMLAQYGVLNHAIVVLLSDHGEALELKGDRITAPESYTSPLAGKKIPRFYPPSADNEAVNQSAGHGTDVLGFTQYRTLLAFRLYGLKKQYQGIYARPVLLLNIKPTLLDFISHQKNNGSLLPIILGTSFSRLQPDFFFFESDFSPEAVRSVHPETRNLVFEGIEFFEIDPLTTRISIKGSMGKLIISSKQYAAVNEDWVLALYPRADKKMIPVLVNLQSGKWTLDLNSTFAQSSPHKNMLIALKKFYGNEIGQLSQATH